MAKTKSFSSFVKAAEKGRKKTKDKSYEFTNKTFYETAKTPGKHIRNE